MKRYTKEQLATAYSEPIKHQDWNSEPHTVIPAHVCAVGETLPACYFCSPDPLKSDTEMKVAAFWKGQAYAFTRTGTKSPWTRIQ